MLFIVSALVQLHFFPLVASNSETDECYKQFENTSEPSHLDMNMKLMKVDEVISKYGYSSETHEVTTDDGYILTIFRITGSSSSPVDKNKPAVLLNHGLFCNSHIWLIQHGPKSLAFKLADEHFDVWLLNIRGSGYSQKHVNLTANDNSYWNFTWHEMGIYDLPRVIHHIRNLTGQLKIYYIGYSMGTTEFFVAMSEIPELNQYVATAVLYGPSAYIHHSTNIAKHVLPYTSQIHVLLDTFFGGKLDVQSIIKDFILGKSLGEFCSASVSILCVCSSIRSMIFKHDSQQTNYTLLPLLFSIYPDVTSTKTVVHYAQVMSSGKFRKFDYDSPEENEEHYGHTITTPPEYDLSKITVPTVLFWSDNDNLASPVDVAMTASKLRPETLKENNKVDWDGWTHVDFVTGIDADKLIYDHTIDIIKNKRYG